MFQLLGPLLGAATSLFGMSKASDEAEDARNQQNAWREMDWQRQNEMWEKNAALQKEFAQSGIQWRTNDAKAAGIHPIFAMGAGGASFSPAQYVGSDTTPVRDNSSSFLQSMGQDISRALTATMSKEDRYTQTLQGLGLERAQLENDLLKSQIAKANGMIGPPLPTGPSGPLDSSLGNYEYKPTEVTPTFPNNPGHAAGEAIPSVQWTRVGGGLVSQPAPGLKTEDEFGAPLMAEWLARNRLSPFLGSKENKPPMELVKKEWPWATGVRYSRMFNKWVPYSETHEKPSGRGWPYGDSGTAPYRGSSYHGASGFDYIAP